MTQSSFAELATLSRWNETALMLCKMLHRRSVKVNWPSTDCVDPTT